MWGRVAAHPRAAAFGAVAVAVISFVAFGGLRWVTGEGNVERLLTDTGVVGPLVFIGIMWVTQPFGVPGVVYLAPAGVIWPAPLAVALCWVGNMGASLAAFAFARWMARDWAQQRIPKRMEGFHDRLHPDALRPVIALRVVFGQLPPADWLLGVTRVSTRTFVIGTAIGIVPGIVFFVLVGGSILQALADLPTTARWVAIAAIGAAAVAVQVVRRSRESTAGLRAPEV